ncbi:MAG: VOC family protein [Chthoniobacter sp.]|uniref:bleomycin resistance protein n=1 Tax=Chthoniobacter sp. TaxID=2510640 RepID=UPI0032AD69FD
MATDYEAKALSPILPVAEMAVTVAFYQEVLGFEAVRPAENYTILRRGGVSLHLTTAAPGVLERARGHLSIYLRVEKIESLWAHMAQFKDRYKVRDLFDRDYGMREFHIIDPDGCLVFVGQVIAQ